MNWEKIKIEGLKKINEENNKAIRFIRTNLNKFDRDFEKKILKSSIVELKKLYFEKKITPTDCLLIHWKQIYNWENKINCVTCYCYNEAIKQCEILENKLKTFNNIKEMPNLFGIPFSCKDDHFLKNYYSTFGCIVGLKNKKNKDETVIKFVRDNGGIILVKGNIPQFLFTIESVNFLFGRSNNPYDLKRTVGGSSGGDAGINLIGGAKIGLTTDGAGSTRIPAIFCGIFGFKYGSNRDYNKNILDYKIIIGKYARIVKGPISRNINDIIYFIKRYLKNTNYKEMNPLNNYIPYNNNLYKNFKNVNKKLKIGYISSINFFESCLPVKNIINETVEELKNKNHELIYIKEIEDLLYDLGCIGIKDIFQKGQKNKFNFLEGEKLIDEYKIQVWLSFFPNWVKNCIFYIMKLFGEKRFYEVHKLTSNIFNSEAQQNLNEMKWSFYKYEKIFEKYDLDCIWMPSLPYPAIKHGTSPKLSVACIFYLGLFNYLDVPSCVIPIRKINNNEQIYEDNHNDSVTKVNKECLNDSEGLPISIQLIGMKNQEEKLLGIMNHFKNIIKIDNDYLIK